MALLPGVGPIPADTVADLIASGAAVTKPVSIPPADAAPESGYRPSATLLDFLRWRDLTCRAPGCEVPAEFCDADHTIPWPYGPTHASNLKLYCRRDHVMKTFWFDRLGWTETQDPDGTLTIRIPDGRSFVTKPTGALYFPQLGASTGQLVLAGEPPPTNPDKSVKMPLRARSRSEGRAARIAWERGLHEKIALANPPPF